MKETRFYVLTYEEIGENTHYLTAKEDIFLEVFKDNYRVYDSEGFQEAFNGEEGEICSEIDFLRIIN